MDGYLAANRANWEDRVPIHVASQFYDVETWLREGTGPRAWEREELGSVEGLDLVHLQCHFGLDTLAWARAGARVTGLDFSARAIAQARQLAQRAGLAGQSTFLEADVLQAAEALGHETYDIVYVSLGALCWLPSVGAWARQAAALLRPGGRLYLHDGHPLAWSLAEDDLRVENTYFEERVPLRDDCDVTYTDGAGRLAHHRSYEWNHSLGQIVTAVLESGLVLDRLTEHDWTVWPRFPWLQETPDHRWQVPAGQPRIPLTFTLVASRP